MIKYLQKCEKYTQFYEILYIILYMYIIFIWNCWFNCELTSLDDQETWNLPEQIYIWSDVSSDIG